MNINLIQTQLVLILGRFFEIVGLSSFNKLVFMHVSITINIY